MYKVTAGRLRRWEKLRKSERNRLIIARHEKHPDEPLSALATIYGISKQRVHYIIRHYGG